MKKLISILFIFGLVMLALSSTVFADGHKKIITLAGLSGNENMCEISKMCGDPVCHKPLDSITTQYFYNNGLVITRISIHGKAWIHSIKVTTPNFTTSEGVKVGDSLDIAARKYPLAIEPKRIGDLTYWAYLKPWSTYALIFAADNRNIIVEMSLSSIL